jgi:hypothetical protein
MTVDSRVHEQVPRLGLAIEKANRNVSLDWITTTAPREHRVDLSFCEEPRLGAKGAVNEDYRL